MGAALTQPLAARFPRGKLVIALLIGQGLLTVVFALVPVLGLNISLLLVWGVNNGVVNVVFMALIQELTPDGLLGRVFGSLTALLMMASPLGAGLAGLAGEVLLLSLVFTASGVLFTLASLTLLLSPAVREIPVAAQPISIRG